MYIYEKHFLLPPKNKLIKYFITYLMIYNPAELSSNTNWFYCNIHILLRI